MGEDQPLSEFDEKVDQLERRQETRHLLFTRVLKLDNVRIKVPHDGRLPPQEAVEILLNIRMVIKSVQGEVNFDERGMLCTGNDFAAHHVRPMEARGSDNHSLWPIHHEHTQPPFQYPGRGDYHLGAQNIVP